MKSLMLNKNYKKFLTKLKERIKFAQLNAALAVNHELIKLYWRLGKAIIEKQKQVKWGNRFIESLSHDLQNAFPGIQGFSVRNLEKMRKFAGLYPGSSIPAQAVPELPWGHICLLIERIKDIICGNIIKDISAFD